LIAQSLICLRTCLETFRTQNSGYLTQFHHEACTPLLCVVECSSNLTLHLKSYLDEFSRVIFRKENLQSDRAWWLSAFYSLCIQDLVRKLLLSIVRGLFYECGGVDRLAPRRYLHLAVKLFLASSGGYDPIVLDYSGVSAQTTETDYFRRAQEVVNQSAWAGMSINSSRDYLYRLFEVDGTLNAEGPEFEDAMGDLVNHRMVSVEGLSIDQSDRRETDGSTVPQVGAFQCTYPGCAAYSFLTQYLLTEHEIVHMSRIT
jgi:hypothetical protein